MKKKLPLEKKSHFSISIAYENSNFFIIYILKYLNNKKKVIIILSFFFYQTHKKLDLSYD